MNLKEYLANGPKKMFSLLEGIVTVELVMICKQLLLILKDSIILCEKKGI
jgi:hypothetical protein